MAEQMILPVLAQPELGQLRLGFVALTDCAPLVAAEVMELGKPYGLAIELRRQPSWAAVRDKLLSGELDAAHSLYGLPYGVQLGLGGPQADMAVLMTLNRNGQAISGSNRLVESLQKGMGLRAALAGLGRKPVFAQTFPTGTHAMWLNYWLAAHGINPLSEVDSIVIPPPQMADAMAQGELDGFCAGEPWHSVARAKGVGRMLVSSGAIWPDHPEKALACRRDFAALYPNTAKALVRTLLDACRWLESPENRRTATGWLAGSKYLGLMPDAIAPSLVLPEQAGSSSVRFFGDAAMNAPRPSEGLWFLSQYRRWGMLHGELDLERIAHEVSQSDLFGQAAGESALPAQAAVTLIDGIAWNGRDAAAYADAFKIPAESAESCPG